MSVTHLSGSAMFDRKEKKEHLAKCKQKYCPQCKCKFTNNIGKDNKIRSNKVAAHVISGWIFISVYLVTTCRKCNSAGSNIPFTVDSSQATFLTNDPTKYYLKVLNTKTNSMITSGFNSLISYVYPNK